MHSLPDNSICTEAINRIKRAERSGVWALHSGHRANSYPSDLNNIQSASRTKADIAAIDAKITTEARIKELEEELTNIKAINSEGWHALDALERSVESAGWVYDEAAGRWSEPPEIRKACQRCEAAERFKPTVDRDPFSSIESTQALADERRERLEAGYSSRVVDAVRK